MKVSIALCTFNGAAYIEQQLESLLRQSRLPDELVVCDDCSTDETVRIVRDFSTRLPFPLRLEVNKSNVGAVRNFDKAIGLCTGDIIALCDQDDYWLPQKIERIEAAFRNRRVGLVFSDAEIVDVQLQPLGYRLWQRTFPPSHAHEFDRGRTFDILIYSRTVTGATMAIRADLKPLILPIPELILMIHDGWIAFMCAAVSKVKYIPEPLMLYRQHAHQLVGAPDKEPVNRPVRWHIPETYFVGQEEQKLRAVYQRLVERRGEFRTRKVARRLRGQLTHIESRRRPAKRRRYRVLNAVRELVTLRYHHYSDGWQSFREDVS